MTSTPSRLSLAAGSLLGVLAASPGLAADATTAPAATGALDEIVVTAQRREQRLEDVPMSITTFSQEQLDQQGLRTIDDLSRLTPGITFMRNGMSSSGNYNDEDSDISIRGIDSTAGASTTGIYMDDTPIQTRHLQFGTVNPFPALFDLERVEVLKGPQGTLFGAGSEGGTIRFITPEPSLNTYQVYARAEVGQVDGGGQNYEAGLAVGGPIIENVLGFRFSVSYRQDGGWVDRVNYTAPPSTPYISNPPYDGLIYDGPPSYAGTTEKNANWHDTQTARLALKWAPTDNLTVSPSIYAQTLHYNDTGAYWVSMSNPSDNTYYNGNAQRDPSTDPWYLGAIKVDWTTPVAHVVSNTSYFSRNQHSVSDYTQWLNTVFFGDQFAGANGNMSQNVFGVLHRQPEQFHAGNPGQLHRSASPAHLDRRTLLFARTREHDRIHLRSELRPEFRSPAAAGKLHLQSAGIQHAGQAVRGVRRGQFQVYRYLELHRRRALFAHRLHQRRQ